MNIFKQILHFVNTTYKMCAYFPPFLINGVQKRNIRPTVVFNKNYCIGKIICIVDQKTL